MMKRFLLTLGALLLVVTSASAQIAYDNSTDGGLVNPATSLTFSHTTSGSNRILFSCAFGDTTDVITGMTYAGAAMTLVNKVAATGARYAYLYYLIAPASGANNLVISASSSIAIYGMASSYTGAKQSAQPDSSNTGVDNGTADSLTLTTTTVADNSWAVSCTRLTPGSGAATAGAGTTSRQSTANGLALMDSNAAKTPAGSTSLITNDAFSGPWGGIIASFSPAAGGAATPCLRSLMGVGCEAHAQ